MMDIAKEWGLSCNEHNVNASKNYYNNDCDNDCRGDSGDACKKLAVEKIKSMALERKLARLALMTRLEETKEEFLLASHMRNHTIFMQFFADLEGYLANTELKDIKLDFFDMRYLESEAFKKLR